MSILLTLHLVSESRPEEVNNALQLFLGLISQSQRSIHGYRFGGISEAFGEEDRTAM
jgi:hypothetical protein